MVYTIHGWGFSKDIWKLVDPKKPVAHIELPGHGNSEYTQTSIEKLSEELLNLIKIRSNDTLIGWSLGATVGCVIASRIKLKNLILIAPTPLFSGISQPPAVVKKFLRDLSRNYRKTIDNFISMCKIDANLQIPLPDKQKATELLINFCYFDLRQYLKKLNTKVTIIVSQEDEITGINGAIHTFNIIRNTTMRVLYGNSHFPYKFIKEMLPGDKAAK